MQNISEDSQVCLTRSVDRFVQAAEGVIFIEKISVGR